MEGLRSKKERKARKVVNMGAKANDHIIVVIMSILLSFHNKRELKRERNKTDFKISKKYIYQVKVTYIS